MTLNAALGTSLNLLAKVLDCLCFALEHQVGPKTIPSRTHCLCTPGEEEEVEEGIEGWEGSTAVGHTTVGLVTTTAAPKTAASVKQVVKRKRFRRSVHKISLASK